MARSNAANSLRKLGRLDEARREVERAIVCKQPFGHAAEPWKAFDDPQRDRARRRAARGRSRGAAASDRGLSRLPPRRRREPVGRDHRPALRRAARGGQGGSACGVRGGPRPARRQIRQTRLSQALCWSPCVPSLPATATPHWPTTRPSTTTMPPRSSCSSSASALCNRCHRAAREQASSGVNTNPRGRSAHMAPAIDGTAWGIGPSSACSRAMFWNSLWERMTGSPGFGLSRR